MSRTLERIFAIIVMLIAVVIVAIVAYVAYMETTYSRISDNIALGISRDVFEVVDPDVEYTAVTYNIGFGAYTPEFTFFMDEGVMQSGQKTQGARSRAESQGSVTNCTQGVIETIRRLDPTFTLLQEVDTDADRSHHVNQADMITASFPQEASVFASNYHSSFLAYPPLEPHGIVNSGLLTLSRFHIDEATRRSLPVNEGFINKFFDMDRCFSVCRLPVTNGKQFVLVNTHFSLYDTGGVVRSQQLKTMNLFLQREHDMGNYVVVGGDWNHALYGSERMYPTQQQIPLWVQVLDNDEITEGYSVICPTNLGKVASCRNADIPYQPGVSYTVTLDGFIVSDNVQATTENIDTGFENSDHNPVKLTFRLLP